MSPSPVNSLCPYVASTPYPVPYNGNSPSPANSLYPCVASTLNPVPYNGNSSSPANSLYPCVASTLNPVPYDGNSPSPANSLCPYLARPQVPSHMGRNQSENSHNRRKRENNTIPFVRLALFFRDGLVPRRHPKGHPNVKSKS